MKKNDTKATKKTVEKEEEKIVKVVTKGGAAVDQYLPNKDSYKVF